MINIPYSLHWYIRSSDAKVKKKIELRTEKASIRNLKVPKVET